MKQEALNIKKTIEAIKCLGIDMIDTAGSGHPGIVLGAAPIMYTLFANHLIFNPEDETWFNRDRFILSAGHGSALLYSTLYMSGYNIELNDLKKFRSINSILPGHPEYKLTPGVEITTGPLGQGIANGVGMALSERYLSSLLTEDYPKQNIMDHYIYVLCGDGDLMEGISYEAASFAGTQKLGKLILLYDSNNISLDGNTNTTFTENVLKRFEALGWHTEYVADGNNTKAIDRAISQAKNTKNKPSIIEIKTIIGEGTKEAGQNTVHGKPLSKEEITKLKSTYGLNDEPFAVSKDATIFFRNKIKERTDAIYIKWQKDLADIYNLGNEYVKNTINFLKAGRVDIPFNIDNLTINDNYADELRNTNSQILNIISDRSQFLLGGSADLASSTKVEIKKSSIMTNESRVAKNTRFGVREHAMGGILNGMATYGLRVFGSTFLTFSDYLKPAIRLSALMNLPVTYIFTHDSITIGEDGATHQPIEQLAALRTIPNLNVFRPADINEIIGSWSYLLKFQNPSTIIISKEKTGLINGTKASEVAKGAYIVRKEKEKLDGIIIATGTEVNTAVKIANDLANKNIELRIISMPCTELYNLTDNSYKETIIPSGAKTITLEASNDPIWYKFASNDKSVLKIDDFGYSGKKEEILKAYGFDYDSLKDKIEKLLK